MHWPPLPAAAGPAHRTRPGWALTCVRSHRQRRREVLSGLEMRGRLSCGAGGGEARGGGGAAVAQAPALRQQMRRRREVSAIHAGPRPRPAAASSKQRGRGLGAARSAGGARVARRRRRLGSPAAQAAEPVSTPADSASRRAAALRAGGRRAGPWSAEASRRDR